MNMIVDNNQQASQMCEQNVVAKAVLHISRTPPTPPTEETCMENGKNNNGNNSGDNTNGSNGIQNSSLKVKTNNLPKNSLKRSFDVAFLMMPDERLQQNHLGKQQQQLQQQQQQQQEHQQQHIQQAREQQSPTSQYQQHFYHLQPYVHLTKRSERTDRLERSERHERPELYECPDQLGIKLADNLRRCPQITIRTAPRIYDDPTVIIPPSSDWETSSASSSSKSAFTKVASRLESPGQPTPSLSPDQLSCSSTSPPVATTPPRSASGSSSDIITIDNMPPTSPTLSPTLAYHAFRPEYPSNGAFQTVQAFHNQRLKQQLLYRPAMLNIEHPSATAATAATVTTTASDFLPAVYAGFPFTSHHVATVPHHPFAGIHQPELPRIVQNPAAAAILSTLIPPTLASTFTLTAQNVCAKCNISFRMTSDLVYHMRSHHKSEVTTDPNRRKREEKLKCPVCQESFRERHHLTRHMTAHQDKESDQTTINSNNTQQHQQTQQQQHQQHQQYQHHRQQQFQQQQQQQQQQTHQYHGRLNASRSK